jgi:hypothetical protein
MNYATLAATISAYTENKFPDDTGSDGLTSTQQINTFIMQAEQRIFNEVQLLELRKNVTGSTTGSSQYLAVPSDWLANFSLAVIDPNSGQYTYLLNKDVNFIREAFPYPNTQGTPTHYAMFDQNVYLLGPTPDKAYQMELHYFYYPPSITTAGTSWLGNNFDSVLLYGSLLEAYTFMKGEADILAQYQKRYDEALALLKEYAEGKNRQDMYRTPQVRYPVK